MAFTGTSASQQEQFLQEVRSELVQGLERVAELLEWLKTREVIDAVECENIIAAGSPHHQADALINLLARKPPSDFWLPLWNGLQRFCPSLHTPLYTRIVSQLGPSYLAGLQAPKQDVFTFPTGPVPYHIARPTGMKYSPGTASVPSHYSPTGKRQFSPPPTDYGGSLDLVVERLTQERNAARVERAEALAQVDQLVGQMYALESHMKGLQSELYRAQEQAASVEKQLSEVSRERNDALLQLEKCKEQRKIAFDGQKHAQAMLASIQSEQCETLKNYQREMDEYEQVLDRVRRSEQTLAEKEDHIRYANSRIHDLNDLVTRYKTELDMAIPFEVKDGHFRVRRVSSQVDSGVQSNATKPGSESSHAGITAQSCQMNVNLDVGGTGPGIYVNGGVFVQHIDPHSSAAIDGQLAVGDRILEINDLVPSDAVMADAMIRGCPRRLRLLVSRQMMVPSAVLQEVSLNQHNMSFTSGSVFRGLPGTGGVSRQRVHASSPVGVAPSPTGMTDDRLSMTSLRSVQSGQSIQSFRSMQVGNDHRHIPMSHQHLYSPGKTSSLGRQPTQIPLITPPGAHRNIPVMEQLYWTQPSYASQQNTKSTQPFLPHYASVPDFTKLPGQVGNKSRQHNFLKHSPKERKLTMPSSSSGVPSATRPRASTASEGITVSRAAMTHSNSGITNTTSTSSELLDSSTTSSSIPNTSTGATFRTVTFDPVTVNPSITTTNTSKSQHTFASVTDGYHGYTAPSIKVTEERVVERNVPIQLRAPRAFREAASMNSLSQPLNWKNHFSNGDVSPQREIIIKNSSSSCNLEGFELRGGCGRGLYIASVPDWMADENLMVGDRILFLGGTDMYNATYEKCFFHIQSSLGLWGGSLAFLVKYDQVGYNRLSDGDRDNFFIRCLFNQTTDIPGELSFSSGDIINVKDTMFNDQPDVWFAFRVKGGVPVGPGGTIPSKNRATSMCSRRRTSGLSLDPEEVVRLQQLRANSGVNRRGSLRNLKSLKNHFKRSPSSGDPDVLPVPMQGSMSIADSLPKGYELVELVTFDEPRPVLLLGPLADKIGHRLQHKFPRLFTICYPEAFTSREVVRQGIQNRTIVTGPPEAVRGDFLCITMKTIKKIRTEGAHCILDVPPTDIPRLEELELYPIIIFLRPKSEKKLRILTEELLEHNVPMATIHDAYEDAMEAYARYKVKITSSVDVGTMLDHAIQRICTAVQQNQQKEWVAVGAAYT